MNPRPASELRALLDRIDGSGYGAWRALGGAWGFAGFTLVVDRVQRDPFAPPSRVRVFRDAEHAGFLPEFCRPGPRAEGLACRVARGFAEASGPSRGRGSSGPGAGITMVAPGQEVLPISAVLPGADGSVEARFAVHLPGRGRRVDGRSGARLLLEVLPRVVDEALTASAYPAGDLALHALVNEDAHTLRARLRERGLVAFVADGAHLPRRSGIDERPLEGPDVVPFESPTSLRVALERPNAGPISGMGIPAGVTLVTGGGYHGKSTLLRALARGVWNHRPGDGREWVVTDPDAVKIRAEDGRPVAGVDISPFIGALPGASGTAQGRAFSTENASGSTSQAAAIVEALEVGARVLLVDEDTAATNFMIRDRRMQELVPKAGEPITPFVDRVRELHRGLDISSVLVIGGSGDYLDEADLVLGMRDFRCHDVTERARKVAAALPTGRIREAPEPMNLPVPRIPDPATLDPSSGRHPVRVRARGVDRIEFGRTHADVRAVEPLASEAQLRGIAEALAWIALGARAPDAPRGGRTLAALLDALEAALDAAPADGGSPFDLLAPDRRGDLEGFRRHEVAAALNRLRGFRVLG